MSRPTPLDGAEIERQVALLRDPPPPAALDRPCTADDGLRIVDDSQRAALLAAWKLAAEAGRFSKFVPASGAASRMFSMLEGLSTIDSAAEPVRELLERIDHLPFRRELAAAAPGAAGLDRLVAIVSSGGLDYGRLAKGLIPFHDYPGGARTPMLEHLVEGSAYVLDAAGRGRVHFTVGDSHLEAFRAEAASSPIAERWEIGFSTQSRETDTVALEADGSPVRKASGELLLRPGGHGALLRNLETAGGDLVFLKNIDNVLPESRQELVAQWQRILGGLLVSLERRAAELVRELESGTGPATLAAAADFSRRELGREPGELGGDADVARRRLLALIDRPLRVAGMVPSTGEPGGGPFWVRDATGEIYPQIVESAQVDLSDPTQRRIWESSTHFNPVMLAVSLRRHDGRSHPLADFVDQQAVFVNEKPYDGRTIRVLERPGLWNGAMAGWNTVFVEVPLATFAPVKTILDLLRPEHQGV